MTVADDAKRYFRRFWLPNTFPKPAVRRRERCPSCLIRKGFTVEKAYKYKLSRVWLTFTGTVLTILPDDTIGNRHQRFIVSRKSGLHVQIAHNLDLAQRVPVALGDTVVICGEYLWNRNGGAMHWTHNSPKQDCEMGYIYHPATDMRYQ